MSGERREVTILMTDLRGFTSIFEHVSPQKTIQVLNRYFDEMTAVIASFDGTLIEFIGDAILAIFGAPQAQEDHAERAAACALAMQSKMPHINQESHAQGLPEIAMGIGVHTGEVVAGNIGASRLAKFGVIGKEMRVASRIESLTVGGQILISGQTLQKAPQALVAESLTEIEIKGFPDKFRIYELLEVRAR